VSDALGAHLRRLRGEEQKRAATAGILWGARYPWWGGSGESANRGWKP